MSTLFIVIGSIVLYLAFGFFGARITYLDTGDVPLSWIIFLTGPFGWAISMMMVNGTRAEGHYMSNVGLNVPFVKFIKNKLGEKSFTERVLRIK